MNKKKLIPIANFNILDISIVFIDSIFSRKKKDTKYKKDIKIVYIKKEIKKDIISFLLILSNFEFEVLLKK